MSPVLLLFIEILVLFFLSRKTSMVLSQGLYRVFHHEKIVVFLVALLFLPGVIVHELSHYLVATLLFVKTGKIEFMPVVRGDSVKLGSVEVSHTDPLRKFLIGIAPIVVGLVLLFASFYYLTTAYLPISPWIQFVLLGIIAFELSNTMFSSRKDMEGVLPLLVVFVLATVGGLFFGANIIAEAIRLLDKSVSPSMIIFYVQVLLLPLGIDMGLILLVKLLFRP